MKKRKITNEILKEEIIFSKEYSEKYGKHTDKLGRMMIDITDIIVKKLNITSISKIDIQDMKQDMIIEMLWVVNKYCATGSMPDNVFNVFITAGKRYVFEYLDKIKTKRERDEVAYNLAKKITEENFYEE